jgi:hypothetical protein
MKLNLLLLFVLLFGAGQAQAELRLAADDDGAPALTSRDTLAAFSPASNEIWVVAPQGPLMVDRNVAAKAGWKVETLRVKGGVGVKITQAVPQPWRLRILPWGWKVMNGSAQKLPPVRLNISHGKNGLKVDGQTVLTAQSADGRKFWVVPAAGPVPGGVESLSGLAINPANAAMATASAVPTSPAASPPKAPTGKVVAHVPFFTARSLHGVATPGAMVEDLKALVTRVTGKPAPAAVAAATPVVVTPTSLPALPAPVALLASAAGAYRPGTPIAFTLPQDWIFAGGQVVPAAEAKRREARAAAMSAVEVALEQAGKVNLPVPAEMQTPHVEAVTATPVSASVAQANPADETPSQAPTALGWPRTHTPGAYLPMMQKLLARITKAPTRTKPLMREDLAVFDVAWGRGPEALAALAANTSPLSNRGRFARALAFLENNRPDDALADLQLLDTRKSTGDTSWRSSIDLWHAVALSRLGRNAEALKTWPAPIGETPEILASYPPLLRQMAQLDYATSLVDVGELAAARAFTDTLADSYKAAAQVKNADEDDESAVPPRLTLLRGLSRLNSRDEKTGLRLLAAAAEQKTDLESAYKAKFAFVEALQRRGELAQPQYIRYLAELARYWRGDQLEIQVLHALGKQYVLTRDYRAALTTYRDLVHAAPGLPDMADITDQMTAALLAAFDPESPAAYDPLEYVGMYYDFRELVPADERGDRISERVAEILLQMGLPERSRQIAEQLLKYRLKDPVSQGRVALLLARAQEEAGDAPGSLRTLEDYQKVMTTTVQKQQWQVASARALADLGQLASAQKLLKDRSDAAVEQVKADVAWQNQDWKTLASTLRPVVSTLNPASVSGSLPLAVIKLAYADTETHNVASLKQLQRQWAGVGGDNGAAVFSTLAGTLGVTPSAVLAQQPLGQVAKGIASAEQLTQHINEENKQAAEQREEVRQYDDKMRYMELLPPPRI